MLRTMAAGDIPLTRYGALTWFTWPVGHIVRCGLVDHSKRRPPAVGWFWFWPLRGLSFTLSRFSSGSPEVAVLRSVGPVSLVSGVCLSGVPHRGAPLDRDGEAQLHQYDNFVFVVVLSNV